MNNLHFINKKAIAILRVSSLAQADGFSHDVQAKSVQDHCARYDLNLVKIFPIVESGRTSLKRKHYQEAMDFAFKNKVWNILFYKQDRECRNMLDHAFNVERVKSGKICIHYTSENRILHKESPDADFLMHHIFGAVNEDFSNRLSSRVRDAMRMKAEKGWYPSNHPPLGYIPAKIDEAGKPVQRGGIIIPDNHNPNNIKVVKKEFELRAEGFSYEAIRKTILELNLLSPKKAKEYKISAIENRLKNPFYRGQFTWDDKIYIGKHERIIDDETIKKVDATFGSRGMARRDESEETLLVGGWLKCSCGCNIVYDPKVKTNKTTGKKKVHHYYHCTNGKKKHSSQKGLNISGEKIWNEFGDLMGKIEISDDFAKDIAEALNKMENKAHNVAELQIAELKEKEHELEAQEDRVLELLMEGTIDKKTYGKQMERIRENRESLFEQLEKLQKSLTSAVVETAKTVLELARDAKSLWKVKSPKERKEFLNAILSNPVLDGATVRYDLKKPFAVLLKMAANGEKENWRVRKDSNLRHPGSKPGTLSS